MITSISFILFMSLFMSGIVRGKIQPPSPVEVYIEPTTTIDKAIQSDIIRQILEMEEGKRANPTVCFTNRIL